MKSLLIATVAALLLTTQARAADPELSIDSKRMLAYGTLAVLTGACKTPLTPAQSAKIKSGLEQSSEAQKQFTEAEFTDAMKGVGAQVGANKEQVCDAMTPEFVDTSLEQAAAGE